MPIVYVHGVATRRDGFDRSWDDIERYLRHYAAPALGDADRVAILPAYWGDVASGFRFGGASRPRTPLFGMGSATQPPLLSGTQPPLLSAAEFAAQLPDEPLRPPGGRLVAAGPAAPSGPLVAAGPTAPSLTAMPGFRDLTPEQLSDLAAACAYGIPRPAPVAESQAAESQVAESQVAEWLVAADEAAHDPEVQRQLRAAPDDAAAQALYLAALERRVEQQVPAGLTGMGAKDRWRQWRQRIAEASDRGSHLPSFAVSRVLGEARKPVNTAAVRFMGDVFVYLDSRVEDGKMGPIPRVVLETLQDADQRRLSPEEPLVVVSHSMGGQIIYDMVTHFLPAAAGLPAASGLAAEPADGERQPPRIDFWCATASQVGLFLDLNLFLAADDGTAPLARPSSRWLGTWWNVWDYNDFLSFSVRDIVRGVDDEPYSSGLSLASAHSGYLQRPTFYRRLRGKLDDARSRNWDRDPAGDGQDLASGGDGQDRDPAVDGQDRDPAGDGR
jgi:hypothetical protein